jgi:hypothetical protein
MPFQIGVVFDGTELDPEAAASPPYYTYSVGFAIGYTQVAC